MYIVGMALFLLPVCGQCQTPPPPGPPIPAAPTPPLGRKLQEVVALRTLLALHLTAQDIDFLLPKLRALKQAEQTLQLHVEQDIDTERQALLADGPNAAAPPDSSAKIAGELALYQQRRDLIWTDVTNRLGSEKSEGLRRLAGLADPPALGPPKPGPRPVPEEVPGRRPTPHPSGPPALEPHLPLSALISLLEQKRAAMPH